MLSEPEHVILRKLDWFRLSGGALERQLRDVTGVLKANVGRLDLGCLRSTASQAGLLASLEACLADAGIAD